MYWQHVFSQQAVFAFPFSTSHSSHRLPGTPRVFLALAKEGSILQPDVTRRQGRGFPQHFNPAELLAERWGASPRSEELRVAPSTSAWMREQGQPQSTATHLEARALLYPRIQQTQCPVIPCPAIQPKETLPNTFFYGVGLVIPPGSDGVGLIYPMVLKQSPFGTVLIELLRIPGAVPEKG